MLAILIKAYFVNVVVDINQFLFRKNWIGYQIS